MTAQGNEGRLGRRLAIVIGVAALGAAVIAAGASANFKSVHDPRGDTKCLHDQGFEDRPCSDWKMRNADIVRASAGHEGTRLRHTIRVVGKFHAGVIWISTDSDRLCEFYLIAFRGAATRAARRVRDCSEHSATGRATYDFHRHSVEMVFSERSIGSPQSYRWRFAVYAGPARAFAADSAPNRTTYITHRLG